ncbi:insulin receptor substrate 2 [Pogona vitticeps]
MASPLAPEPPGRCSAGPGNLNNNNNNQPPPPQQEPPPQQQPPQEPPPPPPGVRKCGYLRKHKHGHKRFFVLRAPIAGSGAAGGPEGSGSSSPPARLEYYESEKKWRSKSGAPKRSIALDAGLNVHKRADAKHKHLVALYTRDEYVALAAESEQEQEAWYQAIAELLRESQPPPPPATGSPRHPLQATVAGSEDSGYGPPGGGGGGGGWGAGAGASGGSAYREVWQVTLKPKGLGQSRHLTGVHRLCLAARTVGLVRLNCERPCVTLQLMNIRRCGHSDSFFFMELGRSASTGPGELWMQADDSVVAQNIHETILEAMKALRELAEFRPRSKSQSSSSSSGGAAAASAAATGRGGGGGGGGGGLSLMCSRPISVPGPRRHPRHPCTALPPSQTGLLRRSRTDILAGASGLSAAAATTTTTTNTRARTASEGDGFRVASLSGSGSPLSPDSGPPSRSHLPPGRSLPLGQAPSWVSKVAGEAPGAALSQPRPSGSSASGSPSDVAAAFLAFEDLDSSPVGNPRPSSSLTAANNIHTPDTPPGQHLDSSYIAMDRGHLCYSSGRCESAGRDMGPRKRTCSLTTPAHQHLLPLPHSSTSLDDYTLLRATLPPAGCSPRAASIPYPEDYCDVEIGSGGTSSSSSSHLGYSAGKEEGYMPMAPRILSVLPLQGDPDGYMSMSPTSMSPPQSVLHPVPSRIGSESSDDSSYMHMWGTNSRLSGENLEGRSTSGGDYISMSPVSVPSSTSNGFCALGPGIQSSPSHAFWNRATFLGESKDSDQYVFMNSLAVNHTVCNNTTMPLPMCHSRTESSLSQPANSVQPSPLFLGLFLPSINEPRASSGEYVNIGYSQVPPVSDSSTSLFGTGMEGHHRSRFSDYMNLNFEGLQSGATSVGSLEEGLLSGSSPSSGQPDKREVKGGMQETCLSSSFSEASDYTEMLFTTATPPPQPISHQPESTQATSPITGLKQLTLSEMETFLFASPPPDPNYGAKVIRADPQGRRRHSSETFSSTTMVTPVSPSFAHNSKWHNSASVENVSLRKSEDFVEEQNSSPMCRETSAGFQNGLNYIAVNVLDGDHPLKGKHASGSPLNGSISGTYTTVDFLAHNLKETSLVKE